MSKCYFYRTINIGSTSFKSKQLLLYYVTYSIITIYLCFFILVNIILFIYFVSYCFILNKEGKYNKFGVVIPVNGYVILR